MAKLKYGVLLFSIVLLLGVGILTSAQERPGGPYCDRLPQVYPPPAYCMTPTPTPVVTPKPRHKIRPYWFWWRYRHAN